ncbi:MAG TPA: HAD family phosphatase [Terriglobales bacterium]|nr:HAD family phosphatase [Terriglobales bacterium]
MAGIRAIFWDVGGVLLSNAWDRSQRRRALQQFHVDELDFEDRHEMLVSSFERGKITQQDYLQRTVFYRPRSFTPGDFTNFMFSLSQPYPDTLELARSLAGSCKYLMATLNNESTELNDYRIRTYGLRDIFDVFFSSCYVGLRKPEEAIYRLALEISQHPADECCFVDDRPLNVEAASRLGMHAIRVEGTQQLRQEFEKLGVTP